jgi:hypothetical protein
MPMGLTAEYNGDSDTLLDAIATWNGLESTALPWKCDAGAVTRPRPRSNSEGARIGWSPSLAQENSGFRLANA